MGGMNNDSYNFYYADLNVSSIYNINYYYQIDLNQLQSITLGNNCFRYSVHTVIESIIINK